MLHRADEGVVGAAERLAPVGEGHLVDDRLGAGLVGDDEGLDADLALGVVESPRREEAQARAAALRGVPALVAHPARDAARAWSGVIVAVEMISATGAPAAGLEREPEEVA